MLIHNPNERSTFKFGMANTAFTPGSVKYVGSEIRAIILSKMQIEEGKNICVISGESIVVEAGIIDGDGTIIAVEYNANDRSALEDNVDRFGIQNVKIVDHVDSKSFEGLPVPDVTMLVASASMEQEMEYMLSINPEMEFVIYTLDFVTAAGMPALCAKFGMEDPEIIQISVSKLGRKNTFENQPAPWIITCHGGK
jgi:precorrin-6Y C5,15-methyltransferase (decarboxylating)